MDKPTRWSKIIKSLRFNNIPYSLIKKTKIVTKNHKEFEAKTEEDFKEVINQIKNLPNEDVIEKITIETQNRKIKKQVDEYIDNLFGKVFPSKKP